MIANPIVFTTEEVELIVAMMNAEGFGSNSWGKDALDDLRGRIKKYYIREQAYECCYCKQYLYTEHGRSWDIEHVIAMALKCGFMFEPRNLAIACVECNGAKRAKPVSHLKRVSFPDKSAQYWIVHPHFDDWEEHIELEGDTTYRALSEKGKFTIYNCDLFRFWEREAKIRQPIRDKRFEHDVGELRFAKTEAEARPIIASILERIKIEEETSEKHLNASDEEKDD